MVIPLLVFAQALNSPPINEIVFEKSTIKLNGLILKVEIARSSEQQSRGLMFRKYLPENEGMLFINRNEKPLRFWMKNTFIPLSIAYFDKDRKILNIEDMKASSSIVQESVDISESKGPAQYALEMNQGWFRKNKILPGHKFEFVSK